MDVGVICWRVMFVLGGGGGDVLGGDGCSGWRYRL